MCGDGIDDKIGFSYDPDVFNNVGIAYFNFYWQDLTCPPISKVLVAVQTMQRIGKKDKRIFVHCHAGTGRTGLVIASYLYYANICKTAHEAIANVQRDRPGSLLRKE